MTAVLLSIGSNIRPEKNVPDCILKLKENFQVTAVSSVYETAPIGPAGDKPFWNLAAVIETPEEKAPLIAKIRSIEESLGRKRSKKNRFAPRTIDIDILPQPGYQNLGFIIIPLAEILPDEKDIETGKTFSELAEKIGSCGPVVKKIIP